jgi:hypothetical protein
MSRSVVIASGVVSVAALGAGIAWLGAHDGKPSAEEQWPLFGQYCIDCHNRDDLTADIAFDRMSAESVAHESEIFEAVVRKLRGAQMPPPGAPQPDQATRHAWITGLEGELDKAAATARRPGQVALHRLNRTEYANAIAALLDLDVDVKALLPKDDESDGFDNVANVLKVSPSFLEQYIAAARVISEMAVGLPNAKRDSRVYYAEPGINQNYHVEGMPLGTRGGMLVEHFFPADGDYEFDLGGMARARCSIASLVMPSGSTAVPVSPAVAFVNRSVAAAGRANAFSTPSVGTGPGATAFTRTLADAHSSASVRVRASMPPFAAVACAICGQPR